MDLLPSSKYEMEKRGWKKCDFILITPDAYIDHPSFAMAVLSRFLEAHGFKVGIISQPRWQMPESMLELGIPEIAFGISGGNVDSMVLNYTPSHKRRNSDAYCDNNDPFFPGSYRSVKNKIRPDRATIVYCNQLKKVCKEKPIIIGGIEASLRRFCHYDYWQNKIKRSILFDSKADVLVYGMGEYVLLEVLKYIASGRPIQDMSINQTAIIGKDLGRYQEIEILPSYDEIISSKEAYAKAFRAIYHTSGSKILAQKQDSRSLVCFPPMKTGNESMDEIYDLPYARIPHKKYIDVPAFSMIKESITILRGCYGNCSFCSIFHHQGKSIISRSVSSILKEISIVSKMDYFDGYISDLGGPCPNMYYSECLAKIPCNLQQCIKSGKLCGNLKTGTGRFLDLINQVSSLPYIKKLGLSSGIRLERGLLSPDLLNKILCQMSSGRLKIAPESGSPKVLELMNKTPLKAIKQFLNDFNVASKKAESRVRPYPYFIVGHPGEGDEEVEETEAFLLKYGLNNNSCQQFTPTPMTLSTAMYYLGYDPISGNNVYTEKDIKKIEKRKNKLQMSEKRP